MTVALHLAPRPCNTCPYERSTAAGIWHPDEYRKLPEYDHRPEGPGPFAVFHCHQENITETPTVCRGWLAVHPDCTAVRMGLAMGHLTPDQRDAAAAPWPNPDLYESGAEAFAAGMAAVQEPSDDAKVAMGKLLARGKFRL